ncbi:MAG: S16 family serine protease [archaeon]
MQQNKAQIFFQRTLFVLILLVLLLTPTLAILQSGNIKIFAVTEDNKGMAADLFMYTMPGTGRAAFIVSNSLVGKDTQTTGNIALQIAQKLTSTKITDKDIIFDIRANATEVDGPSAGAAMTLLSYSMLSEKSLNSAVAMTGTINSDGSVGMVGGVGPKSVAASKIGIKLFMIPAGEAITDLEINGQMETVNLLEYAPKNLGMKVVEVSKIEQAIAYAYSSIEEIKVDVNISTQMFVPKSIEYDPVLLPMRKISENYILEAKTVIAEAKTELEKSDLSDQLSAELYQRHSATKRSIEMAQRFLDQNYLYSAANYAFNARVTAGAIKEIAQNPSLLQSDSTLLDSKISALKKELEILKQKMNFISVNDFEWVIGAQQRVAYAENAIKGIESTSMVSVPSDIGETPNDQKSAEQEMLFSKVYDYVSAEAWMNVSMDFLTQAQKYDSKKVPSYTKDFVNIVKTKLIQVSSLLTDSNATPSTVAEATRRYNSAKVSYDNNFLFAALYDAYFAEAFIGGEANRTFFDQNELFSVIEKDITVGSNSESIWANMFFDHAKFYYENAVFNQKLGRTEDVVQNTQTSYDLIFLSKKITEAKSIVEEYLAFNKLADYIANDSQIDIKYTKREDPTQYMIVLLMVLSILLVTIILLLGLASKSKANQFTFDVRKGKIEVVLGNLDKALSAKKISDAEYFFMKKRYEDELVKKPGVNAGRKRLNLGIEDLRAKQRALEKGLVDLRRHYRTGLIIPEDYEKHVNQVTAEIEDIKTETRIVQDEERAKHKMPSPLEFISKKLLKRGEPKIKGTEEQIDDDKREEAAERARRRKYLKKFAYKKEKK